MYLRCAGIRQIQYIDTWTCHLHRESRLTTHTDIASPHQTLVQAPYPFPTYTTHTSEPKTQIHVQHSPCSHRIGKAQTQSSHPLTPPPLLPRRPEPKTYTSHILQQLLITRTTLIHSPSAALDTIHEPGVPPTCLALTTTTPHLSPHQHCHQPHCHQPRTITLSQQTHKQQYTHHSHSKDRIHIGTTPTSQTDQRRPQTQHKDTDPTVKVREISSYYRST